MSTLPAFHRRPYDVVHKYMALVLTDARRDERTFLRELKPFDDGHYRAVFDLGYFVLAADQAEPSRSQWNSLKKKMKRHHRGVFVFKEHGILTGRGGEPRGYVDFGFFAG